MESSKYQRLKEWVDDNRVVFQFHIVVAFLGFCIYGIVCNAKRADRLKYHHKVVEGTVIGFWEGSGYRHPGPGLIYYFYVDGKLYQDRQLLEELTTLRCRLLIDKRFPVVYEEGDIYNRQLLVLPQNFREFSIPYPDSLSWIVRPLDEP